MTSPAGAAEPLEGRQSRSELGRNPQHNRFYYRRTTLERAKDAALEAAEVRFLSVLAPPTIQAMPSLLRS